MNFFKIFLYHFPGQIETEEESIKSLALVFCLIWAKSQKQFFFSWEAKIKSEQKNKNLSS